MEMQCNKCGCTDSKYIRKDVAHVGEYCANCGKWKRWISKKDQYGKDIQDGIPTSVAPNNTQPQTGYSFASVTTPVVNRQPVNSACADISDIPGTMARPEKPLQINITPRGVTTVTVSTGEVIELSSISIRVNKAGVTITDVAGNQIKSFKFI